MEAQRSIDQMFMEDTPLNSIVRIITLNGYVLLGKNIGYEGKAAFGDEGMSLHGDVKLEDDKGRQFYYPCSRIWRCEVIEQRAPSPDAIY